MAFTLRTNTDKDQSNHFEQTTHAINFPTPTFVFKFSMFWQVCSFGKANS